MNTKTSPARAYRHVAWDLTGDTQTVQVELSEDAWADEILYNLVSTLRANPGTAGRFVAQIVGKRPLSTLHSCELRRDIAKLMRVHGVDHMPLTDDQADVLLGDLGEAVDAMDHPEPCHHPLCDHLAQPGLDRCEAHDEGAA